MVKRDEPLFQTGAHLVVWNGKRHVDAIIHVPKKGGKLNPERRLGTWAYWIDFLNYKVGEPMTVCLTEADLVEHTTRADTVKRED